MLRSAFGGSYTLASKRGRFDTVGYVVPEEKFYDTSLGVTLITNPTDATGGEKDPSATSMVSTPARGDGATDRDGKHIWISSVEVAGNVKSPQMEHDTSPRNGSNVMVCLVLDTQTNGAQLNSEDVFVNPAGIGSMAIAPLRNLLHETRFKVLKSEMFDVSPVTLSNIGSNDFAWLGVNRSFRWFVGLNLPVNFNAGTSASIVNVVDNSLHIIAYAGDTGFDPTIEYNARIRFRG